MQCPNCDRKFALEDGQFCPYCGAPLNTQIKTKKKVDESGRPPFLKSILSPGASAVIFWAILAALILMGLRNPVFMLLALVWTGIFFLAGLKDRW